MPKYTVFIYGSPGHLSYGIDVEADNREDAKEKARDALNEDISKGNINFDCDEYDYEIEEVKQ